MDVEVFKSKIKGKLSSVLINNLKDLTFDLAKKIIRKKDVKINGVRVSSDLTVNVGDEITVYYQKRKRNIEIAFEDENIIVAIKPRMLEVVNENNEEDLLNIMISQVGCKLYAVHRLDRNTTGLVIFAKNIETKQELDESFKKRTIDKFYLALVFGKVEAQEDELHAYLKKYSGVSRVDIFDKQVTGANEIITRYKLLWTNGEFSLLEVELVTGKTHQIRAHLAHIGHPIVGDEKYGDTQKNKKLNLKYQCLCAYKIIFHFNKKRKLSYLNMKNISILSEKIDFLKFCK